MLDHTFTSSVYFEAAALFGSAGIFLGAFGAHGLQNKVELKDLQNWNTATSYLFYSLPGLLTAALTKNDTAGKLFIGGISIFSGSLYALVLSQKRILGAITPIGGLALAAGWAALMLSK